MSETDWVAPGLAVARVTDTQMMAGQRIVWTKIERLTKTLAITEDGERFPRRDLTLRRGGTWGHRERLMPADDPYVLKLAAEIRHQRRVNKARDLCAKFDHRTPDVTAADVILALAPLTGIGAEIAALFASRETPPLDGTAEGETTGEGGGA